VGYRDSEHDARTGTDGTGQLLPDSVPRGRLNKHFLRERSRLGPAGVSRLPMSHALNDGHEATCAHNDDS
jgi:hypothetical protein